MILKKLANKIGFDKAILFTSASSIVGTIGSVITVILVIKLFDEVEQGFYYTFGSILSIQIFFELGFNNIITQYAAHETGNPAYSLTRISDQDNIAFSRLSSLLHFIVRWYTILFFALLFILSFCGVFFFGKNSSAITEITWQLPWLLLVLSSCLNFFISPIISFIIGIGNVKDVAKLQLQQNVIKIAVLLICLLFDFKLYSIGLSLMAAFLYMVTSVYKKYKIILFDIWKFKIINRISYFKEIFPYQWKIALSWVSGYFIFQMFNPVLFATEGPVVAGQMGMSLAALTGLSTLSISWISTKIPFFSNLIAAKNYNQLKINFNKVFKQSLFVNIFLLLIFLSSVAILKFFKIKIGVIFVGNRFIDFLPLTFMVIATVINQITSSWALYLRCFKKEPYLVNSIVGAILTTASTFYFGNKYGLLGITGGYLFITIIGLPWAFYVYQRDKV
jgi:O-antigen/teichoic acid export membrane protein